MKTDWAGLGWSLTFCISNELLGVADAAGPGSPPSAYCSASHYNASSSWACTPVSQQSAHGKEWTPRRQKNLLVKSLFLCHLHYSSLSPPGPPQLSPHSLRDATQSYLRGSGRGVQNEWLWFLWGPLNENINVNLKLGWCGVTRSQLKVRITVTLNGEQMILE